MKSLFLFLLAACTGTAALAQKADLLIHNGRIIDGTGNAWYYGDVAIRKDRIVAIGHLPKVKARRVIDATGKVVCPGFIDVHTHIEGDEKVTPTADNFIYDGVTSVITGNCGLSEINFRRYFKFLDSLQLSVNVGSFIGHNDIRRSVMGSANRRPSAEEQQRMADLVSEAMQAGAVGLSTGLIYTPGTYAQTEEVLALARAVAPYQGVYSSHIRNETDQVFAAIEEALHIGREAGIPVQISHFKIGKPNWNRSSETLGLVKKAREAGLEVTIDQYPYTASSTTLQSLLPSWALGGGRDSLLYRLNQPEIRQKITAEMVRDMDRRERPDFSYAVVANYPVNPAYNGKSISQVNRELGRAASIPAEIETILDLAEKGSASMVFHSMHEADVENILRYPFTMVASDSGIRAFGVGVPHPRGYGSNARVISLYVREKQVLHLEDAIRRMTSLPAQKMHLRDRGLLQPGFKADILVFDPAEVREMSTYEKPHAYARGMHYVLVNGQVTVAEGRHTGARSGVILYGPAYKK